MAVQFVDSLLCFFVFGSCGGFGDFHLQKPGGTCEKNAEKNARNMYTTGTCLKSDP